MSRKENAIILAAGFSSRFAPLSYEKPKALLEVKGEVLIERQIRQLMEAGIQDITLVVGYKKEMFQYLEKKFQVQIVENREYAVKNNLSSMYAVKDRLRDTYICSADNYFTSNVFCEEPMEAYYSAEYAKGSTEEWCMEEDGDGFISGVTIGGSDAWYMIGHAFFTEDFSKRFIPILEETYAMPGSETMLWEHMYIKYLQKLKMKIKKFPQGIIKEFDSLSELKDFDKSYVKDSRSSILKDISRRLPCEEAEIDVISPVSVQGMAHGFIFKANEKKYAYSYENHEIRGVDNE